MFDFLVISILLGIAVALWAFVISISCAFLLDAYEHIRDFRERMREDKNERS